MARFQAAKPNGVAVQQLEVLVRTALFQSANQVVAYLLQQAADRLDAAYQPRPGWQRKGRAQLTVDCIFGFFPLERDYYYHPGKQQGHYPADAALGLEGGCTPALVNGARQSYRLTDALQSQIQRLARAGQLGSLPPVLTFQSVVDFTVSTPAILTALYAFLPDNGSEIVLFDVNRTVKFGPLLRPSAYVALDRLTPTSPQPYRFTSIINASDDSDATVERSIAPGQLQSEDHALSLPYPPGIFSLSHLAIPIPMDDPLYGLQSDPKAQPEFGFNLGAMNARGERGSLVVDQDFLMRLPSNPFFPYLLERVDEGINRPSGPTGRNLAATASPGIPVRLEALLSTFLSDDAESQSFAGP